eukprot:CAMPEP_0197866624 /NCGR_PEP_ID=MMETSP1438-20131217/44317_1 /TAXON_ID=1461541 /ORGANISM="Pterosperma sp., Strain CCMP1384" /LENGTH=248 /DNA_ID=CAMNT_0043485209 /DNA_START=29 /DNA_END=775 /DNA_ORIENTATION=-
MTTVSTLAQFMNIEPLAPPKNCTARCDAAKAAVYAQLDNVIAANITLLLDLNKWNATLNETMKEVEEKENVYRAAQTAHNQATAAQQKAQGVYEDARAADIKVFNECKLPNPKRPPQCDEREAAALKKLNQTETVLDECKAVSAATNKKLEAAQVAWGNAEVKYSDEVDERNKKVAAEEAELNKQVNIALPLIAAWKKILKECGRPPPLEVSQDLQPLMTLLEADASKVNWLSAMWTSLGASLGAYFQ